MNRDRIKTPFSDCFHVPCLICCHHQQHHNFDDKTINQQLLSNLTYSFEGKRAITLLDVIKDKSNLINFFFPPVKTLENHFRHLCPCPHLRTHPPPPPPSSIPLFCPPTLAAIALQRWTGISTDNPAHWGLHNPHTQPWPEMQRNFLPNLWVGKSIQSFLQKDIQAIITQL